MANLKLHMGRLQNNFYIYFANNFKIYFSIFIGIFVLASAISKEGHIVTSY